MIQQFCPDANILIRLQDVGALAEIARLRDCELVLTDFVWDEVTRKPNVGPAARKVLEQAPNVKRHPLMPGTPENQVFAELRDNYPQGRYHDGELSVIALAATDHDLRPVIFERHGHVAACDELRRAVLTGHWFFQKLHEHHGLPDQVLDACITVLAAKNYPVPRWYSRAKPAAAAELPTAPTTPPPEPAD